jgi:hypothetical protein
VAEPMGSVEALDVLGHAIGSCGTNTWPPLPSLPFYWFHSLELPLEREMLLLHHARSSNFAINIHQHPLGGHGE